MKKIAVVLMVLFLVVTMLFFAASCKQEAAATTTAVSQETKSMRFAFFIPHVSNEFLAGLASNFETIGKEKGVEVTVYVADNDAAKQVSQIENVLTQGIDGVFLEPVSFEGISEAIKAVVDKGIPIITVHEMPSNQDIVNSFVGTELTQVGEKEMEQAVKDLNEKGDIALMYGGMGHPAQIAVTQGYHNIIDKLPDIKVVLDGTGEWVAEKALPLTENWLSTGKHLDAIVSNSDGMAVGILQALRSANMAGQIKVYGIDAESQILEAIKAGEMAGTVKIDNIAMAEKGLDAMISLKNGNQIEDKIIITPLVITKDNVDQYLK